MASKALPYVWYPLFFACAVSAFGIMHAAGMPLLVAVYIPIVLVASGIIVLESKFSENPDWRPTWADIKEDVAFMAIVQVAMPRILALLSILAISGWLHKHASNQWWPHSWSLAAQIIMMVLAVDFMRYWLHRACHHFNFLWRLHEVHHSPDILYTLNVARFHPFEKVLHFSLDTVPFLLLGVAPEVIAGYFLLYSVNGFFQHSNVRLRYGWLNYLVGSAETHRWHHAKDPKTASCNFGNTTIVWDVLFGTWYLPKNKSVDEIGIMDKTYPKNFRAQMLTPFRRLADGPKRRSWKTRIADILVTLHLQLVRMIQSRRIAAAVRNPMRVQRALLARIINANRSTTFGRQNRFADIDNYEAFAKRVPVSEYEALRPFIDTQIERDEIALTVEPPMQYVRTSGTTGRAKDIPLTPSHLKALRRIQQTAVAFQHRTCPEAFAGGILAIVSPAFEGNLPNGKPYGSASGIVARNTPASVLEKFVVPPAVMTISDSRVKYLLILRLALARPDITYVGTANATTLLMLIQLYREQASALIDDLRHGTFFLSDKVPTEVQNALSSRLKACPERADQLKHLAAGDGIRIADLWPAIRMVVTWTCASAGITVDALRCELPAQTRILELGYVSSEFRGTITIGRRAGRGLPTFDTHFFEFVEREKWDSGQPEFLTLDRIRKGVDYYLIVTTPSGLYRYFINDLVRVQGFLHKTPLLKFMQKGKGVTNITGEKLYESQVLAAVRAVMAEYGRTARFVMMLADEKARCYRLYVEPDAGTKPDCTQLAIDVDAKITELNVEYQAKRESKRLGSIQAFWLAAETNDAYKKHCVQQGQREGQFKTVAITYCKDFSFDIDTHIEGC
ncbi:MAG: GH3 family domain-containing protein [Burkholderiaceae bacterium]